MKKVIVAHYPAFLLALLIGTLTLVPQLLAIHDTPEFAGIYKMINNDESYYFARGKDVIDGHPFLSNPYIYEYKNGLPMQIWLPDFLLAKPLGILGIEIHKGYFVYDFIFPTLLTLLSYAVIFFITKSKGISFLGAALLHLNFFLDHFNRSPSPQFNFLFWLLLFLAFLRFIEKPTTSRAVVMGIAFGVLFHVYPYYWTFYVVFFGIFLALSFFFREKIPYRKYALAFGIAFLIALPYLIILYKSSLLPFYDETLQRVGMISTHFPSGRKMVWWGGITLLLSLFSYRYLRLPRSVYSIFFVSGIIATIVVVNQHVITGKNLQFSSHYWQLSVFVYIFALAYLAPFWWQKVRKGLPQTLVIASLTGFILLQPILYGANVAAEGGLHYSKYEIAQQKYAPLFKWLNTHTKKDDVVFANIEISTLIPIYTANNIFYQGLAGLHFMPNSETQERFILSSYWDTIDEAFVLREKFSIWGAYYPTLYDHNQSKNKIRKVLGLPEVKYIKYPPEEIAAFLAKAKDIQGEDFVAQLQKYRVDYLIWDKVKNPNWHPEKVKAFHLEVEDDRFAVYEVQF